MTLEELLEAANAALLSGASLSDKVYLNAAKNQIAELIEVQVVEFDESDDTTSRGVVLVGQ